MPWVSVDGPEVMLSDNVLLTVKAPSLTVIVKVLVVMTPLTQEVVTITYAVVMATTAS